MALRVVHGWRGLAQDQRGAALAFGNFDGVHLGHQAVIADAAEAARRLDAPSAVSSFEPHPRRIFQPEAEPFRLMTLDQQARALDALGIDLFYVLPFNAEVAEMSDEGFAETGPGRRAWRAACGRRLRRHLRQGPQRRCRSP